MSTSIRSTVSYWTALVPVIALAVLAMAWGREIAGVFVVLVSALLAGAVLAAVHHAEVVAHRVGEPYGSLVLAIAVTVIEVALIVTLMISGQGKTETLARDTVLFSAFGSAMASIGLTIPTIAIASIWLPVPLHLGLGPMHIVLLALTCVVTVLTVVPGRATLLQAGVHLALLAAYLFLSLSP